jgi:hypothetical protein
MTDRAVATDGRPKLVCQLKKKRRRMGRQKNGESEGKRGQDDVLKNGNGGEAEFILSLKAVSALFERTKAVPEFMRAVETKRSTLPKFTHVHS